MNIEPQAITQVSPLWLLPAGGVLLALSLCSLHSLQRLVQEQLPALGADAAGSSLLHRWEPRCKATALLGFIFCAVSLTSPWLVLAALLLATALYSLSGLAWRLSLRRLAAISGFLAGLLIMLPLTVPLQAGDHLLGFAGLPAPVLNLRGLELALVIAGKAWTVALLAGPLLVTAAPAATLDALHRLGLPRRVGSLLLISHRYLFVFSDEASRMRTGMQARCFRTRTSWSGLRDLGCFLGMLLVRSFERSERVQQAMLSRGYRGLLPQSAPARILPADWLATAWVLALGLALLLADRLVAG